MFFSGLTIGSCLKETNPSRVQKEPSLPNAQQIDEKVRKLTAVIVQNYIQFWADPLHAGKADLTQELTEAIHCLLLNLCLKLETLHRPTLALHLLTLLRLHLSKTATKREIQTDAIEAEEESKKRCKQVELGVHKLLKALQVDKKWLTSDLLFTTVTKIISNMVVWKLLHNLSQPFNWCLLQEFGPNSKDQQQNNGDVVTQLKCKGNVIQLEESDATLGTSGHFQFQQKRPTEPSIKVTKEEDILMKEEVFIEHRNDPRDSLRLSFQSSGRISSALGNIKDRY